MNHRGEFYNPLGRISALLRLQRPAADDALSRWLRRQSSMPRSVLGSVTVRQASSPHT